MSSHSGRAKCETKSSEQSSRVEEVPQGSSTSSTSHRNSRGSSSSADTQIGQQFYASTSKHKSSHTSSGEQSCATSTSTRNDETGLAHLQNVIWNPFRVVVSQNRRRFQQDGYDLDLTYITDRIIAMGYPADTTEAFYRNSMNHTVNFLEHKHHGHYKVFNLRGQYVYDTSRFHNRVLSFEMTDHHPPRLELMAPFCREVHDYLDADPRNVVVVHCKAGKGRTGVMICAYLTYNKFYRSPRQNMDYYSIVRTKNNKGVTIPSQRRYVYYFSHMRENNLNYMPLRVELVGVYIERAPKVSSSMTRGALSLRVANGDVDVFLGDGIWITQDEGVNEEEEWKIAPLSRGDDSFDPYNLQPGKNVISRRAYGWTVPSDRRVFLEGDVRVDIFSKQKVKLFGVGKDKKKIGHVWFNTMFCCSGFCGGEYRHGDEANPYPPGETTIARRKGVGHRPKSGSASVPNSPPQTPKNRDPGSGSGRSATRAPSFDARKTSKTNSRLNTVVKKITDVAASSRHSEPNIERNTETRSSSGRKKKGTKEPDLEKYELRVPPGLDDHCPQSSLDAIYGKEIPPRVGIEEMLQAAHANNLIFDAYNQRRRSLPQEGKAVAKAPEGRPLEGGPNCIVKSREEHVQIYGALEVDRAFKKKEVHEGFKIIIVTRCVPMDSEKDIRLADSFMRITHQKQALKDKHKQEKIEARQRKIQSSSTGGTLTEGGGEQVNTESCRSDAQWRHDPRVEDPHLKKYFYRQRDDSVSRYPNVTYKCPLLYGEPSTPVPDRPSVTPNLPFQTSPEASTSALNTSAIHSEDTATPTPTRATNVEQLVCMDAHIPSCGSVDVVDNKEY